MKLSYEWLNEYIDLSQITSRLGEKCRLDSGTVPGEGLKGLVAATEVADHPDLQTTYTLLQLK